MKSKRSWLVSALLLAALVAVVLVWQFPEAVAAHSVIGQLLLGSGGLSFAILPGDVSEIKNLLLEVKSGSQKVIEQQQEQADQIKALRDEMDERDRELKAMQKIFLRRGSFNVSGQRRKGFLSDEAAKAFGAHIILGFARKSAFNELDDAVVRACADTFHMETKTALTTADIPLPTEYTQELKELQAEYGVARRVMTHYPIGRGASKPARLGTQDDFTFPIAISAAVTEKNVKLTNASLESHKGGGLLRLPREIDEQGIIPLGQMLARYAARKFGKIEDTIAFLGDGTATYDSISGVCKIANANGKEVQLGVGKPAPSDVTLADLRSLRGLVTTPILSSGMYFFHATWEQRLRAMKTQQDPEIYVQNGPGGYATFDGYPIVWTEIMAPYSTNANGSAYASVFGDLSYWWFGEHGAPRTDFSTDVFFTTDELAVRWLEEIDFDYADIGCASVLRLAAA